MRYQLTRLIALVILSSIVTHSHAMDTNELRTGDIEFYVGVQAPSVGVGGDFNSDGVFTGFKDGQAYAALVPTIDRGMGLGGTVGVKTILRDDFALAGDITYLQSNHDWTFHNLSGDATYRSLSMDLKMILQPLKRLQPYLQVGFGIPSIEISDGYSTLSETGDVTYHGFNLTAGAGLLFYMTRRLAFHAAALYRPTSYTELDLGGDDRAELSDELETRSLDFEVGLTFRFLTRQGQGGRDINTPGDL